MDSIPLKPQTLRGGGAVSPEKMEEKGGTDAE